MADKSPKKSPKVHKVVLAPVETMAMAAIDGKPFEESGLEDTPKNREDYVGLLKELEEMKAEGISPDIPFA